MATDAALVAPAEEQGASFLRRPEVRDVLAWLRLLVDPQDASAVVRALSRPPVELRQVDLARVIQVARRRKVDLVFGLGAATESPRVPPEARERIRRFVQLHQDASRDIDTLAPDTFVCRLIDRLSAEGHLLLAPEEAAQRRASLDGLRSLAVDLVRAQPAAGARDVARQLTSSREGGREEAGSPAEGDAVLEELLVQLRADLLDGIARIGGRLTELRLDTDLDISHGVVRYLELLKVSALLQRPEGESLEEALADVNLRMLAAATPLQREILETSELDRALLGGGQELARSLAAKEERSLGPFLPRRAGGLALSASDIVTYLSCPLRYKFARVLRIPTEQTPSQRFGIAVHQVLERYHSEGSSELGRLLELLAAGLRRCGLQDDEPGAALREKARAALVRYHARLQEDGARPVWFERAFSFRLGPHHLRGRVDRVDRLDGEGEAYELIDYKTSRPRTAEELSGDVQLSLYALAAREDWGVDSPQQAYYYVLDDVKVAVPRPAPETGTVADTVLEVGEGILRQAFDPTPSAAACALCDYRIVCPAAEL
jgi:RecB family exonuclease